MRAANIVKPALTFSRHPTTVIPPTAHQLKGMMIMPIIHSHRQVKPSRARGCGFLQREVKYVEEVNGGHCNGMIWESSRLWPEVHVLFKGANDT
ncbi:hypothetical protein CMV_017258 [Castanea mollissima]|uniref:Uncharacterized protein n=1 Tax=Castanea mollissima TaxID=60419 RepID=A0A8J4VIQ7_9ROSI|nr:hypothetical protein CMV_017258 [Castanea mollissima]